MKRYGIETRRQAVELYFECNHTRKQIVEKLGTSLASVKRWIRAYRDFGEEGLNDHRRTWRDTRLRRPKSLDIGFDEDLDINRRCHQLELENAYLKRLWVLTNERSGHSKRSGLSSR